MTYILPSERARLNREAAVRPGQKFVIIDIATGEWVDDIIYDSSSAADTAHARLKRQHPRTQVIDAVYYKPAEAKMKAIGMRAAGSRTARLQGEDMYAALKKIVDEKNGKTKKTIVPKKK